MTGTEEFEQTPPDGGVGPLQIAWADIASISAGAYYSDNLPVRNGIVTPPEALLRLQRAVFLDDNAKVLAENHATQTPDLALDKFIDHLTKTHTEAGVPQSLAEQYAAILRLGILAGRQEVLMASFEQALRGDE